MCTVLCDCENTINSRPLTHVSEDANDLIPLTPSMFLRENKGFENPDLDIINKVNLTASYRKKQEIIEHLRQRFRTEYLSRLILKSNSVKESRSIKVGEVVLIGDDNKKRIDWPLAKIEKLIQGRDGVARVAVLKTKDGILKRPLQRIYPLEIGCEDRKEIELMCGKEQSMNDKTAAEENKFEPSPNVVKTRSGRVVKKPNYYQFLVSLSQGLKVGGCLE
ncbi:uncharacterized protein LOC131675193 [Phymastichus coffea]|uniref:uncharacterized protein LOC131675193 n=1 Tax=Phymastichus coffea TaxID=108790 RepID=UPI00273C4460|nr:uncharacterized protein LOC131675193 [Phymastichus coffea]